MVDRKREGVDLRELVVSDLRSKDDEARAAFDNEFGTELPAFADATAQALEVWTQFRDGIQDTDDRRIAVTAVAFTAINQNIVSYKLFMSGYTVASGALFRQVLEGVSLASLCSAKSLTVLDRYLDDKYSPNKAVADLGKHAEEARVNRAALQTLASQYNFYHKYAHLSWLTIAAGANVSLGGVPNVGAHFDPGKSLCINNLCSYAARKSMLSIGVDLSRADSAGFLRMYGLLSCPARSHLTSPIIC